MKKLIPFLLIIVVIFSSCNSQPQAPAETSDIEISSNNISIEPETTVTPETEPEISWHYPTFRENNPTWMPADTEDYPDEIKNRYLTFPLHHETTAYGFEYLFESYKDTVYMQDYIYLRITVTNTCDSLQWYGGSLSHAGYFKRDDGELLMAHCNNGSFSDDTNVTHGIDPGASRTYEALFQADHNFFNLEHSYVFVIGIYPTTPVTQHIEIPIQISISD